MKRIQPIMTRLATASTTHRLSALLGVILAGCTGAETNPQGDFDEPFVIPDPPAVGIQLQLPPVEIKSGEDIEFCTYFNLDTKAFLDAQGLGEVAASAGESTDSRASMDSDVSDPAAQALFEEISKMRGWTDGDE